MQGNRLERFSLHSRYMLVNPKQLETSCTAGQLRAPCWPALANDQNSHSTMEVDNQQLGKPLENRPEDTR